MGTAPFTGSYGGHLESGEVENQGGCSEPFSTSVCIRPPSPTLQIADWGESLAGTGQILSEEAEVDSLVKEAPGPRGRH